MSVYKFSMWMQVWKAFEGAFRVYDKGDVV